MSDERLRGLAAAALTPLSAPLPFYAYPFLATTLCGWAWAHLRGGPSHGPSEP